jgi:sigma-B regulation protein RsbU (phosphoserine phosphatase)
MKELINDVLDLTRSRLGGGLQLQVEQGRELAPTLRQVIDELQVANPECVIDDRFDLTEPVDCDHGRIAQMLSNLVGNALTHGAAGAPIQVDATTLQGEFRLSVANEGNPIPHSKIERLFQPFYRGEVRSGQGLGLGLFIASQIAQAHGGSLSVASDASQTVFTFSMPTRYALGLA